MAEHNINTIPEMLRYRWETEPDARVFNFVNKDGPVMSLTCGEIYISAGRFASRLRRYGFESGDVIANGLPNSPERLITDMGIILAGCVPVNCQVVERDGSNFYNVARMSKCRAVIIPYRKTNDAYALISRHMSDNLTSISSSQCFDLTVQQAPTLEKAIIVNRVEGNSEHSLLENLKSSGEDVYCASPSPSDLAALFATSGTAGFSKLVPSTHEAIFCRARSFPAVKDIVIFTDRPMGWIGGFPFDFLAHGSLRFVQDQFDNLQAQTHADLWHVMSHSGCTGATLLPGTIYGLLDLFKDNPPETRLQFLSTGGQTVTRKVADALGVLCDKAVVVSYGSTEAGMICFYVISDPSIYKDYLCGKPSKDVQVKIVDDECKEVEIGKEGHLLLKSPLLFSSHYYNLETNLNPSDIFTPDGFFKTEDRAKFDPEGNVYCLGRRGDVVTMNGTIFYMAWPEQILSKCPFLQDSSVIGVEENGDAFLCACVIPKAGVNLTDSQVIGFFEQAVVDAVQQTASMVRLSHVFVMESFPIVPAGKTDKARLRKTVFEKLGKSHLF